MGAGSDLCNALIRENKHVRKCSEKALFSSRKAALRVRSMDRDRMETFSIDVFPDTLEKTRLPDNEFR
jgi:hypothetical protein